MKSRFLAELTVATCPTLLALLRALPVEARG